MRKVEVYVVCRSIIIIIFIIEKESPLILGTKYKKKKKWSKIKSSILDKSLLDDFILERLA